MTSHAHDPDFPCDQAAADRAWSQALLKASLHHMAPAVAFTVLSMLTVASATVLAVLGAFRLPLLAAVPVTAYLIGRPLWTLVIIGRVARSEVTGRKAKGKTAAAVADEIAAEASALRARRGPRTLMVRLRSWKHWRTWLLLTVPRAALAGYALTAWISVPAAIACAVFCAVVPVMGWLGRLDENLHPLRTLISGRRPADGLPTPEI